MNIQIGRQTRTAWEMFGVHIKNKKCYANSFLLLEEKICGFSIFKLMLDCNQFFHGYESSVIMCENEGEKGTLTVFESTLSSLLYTVLHNSKRYFLPRR